MLNHQEYDGFLVLAYQRNYGNSFKEYKNNFSTVDVNECDPVNQIKHEKNEYIKHLDCRYNVIFIKSIDNPFPILKRCDLFILSSYYEALGLVLLEADTCGIPCIATDVRGPRGFLKKYNGTLVENSEEGILKGMNDFMQGKVKCMNFDAEKYNQQVKKEYEKIFE